MEIESKEKYARLILEVIPAMMQAVRCQMRKHRHADLTVPQFRVLNRLSSRPNSTLTDLADNLGLTPPSAFSLVEGLVAKGMVGRVDSTHDRRRVSLSLTEEGERALQQSFDGVQQYMLERIAHLTQDELDAIETAMNALRPLFSNSGTK